MKQRLDKEMTDRGLVTTRSQAESWIKLGKVLVDSQVITKPGFFVRPDSEIILKAEEQYVSRAGLKLASVAQLLNLDFNGKTVLDVGSSTGGFTDYSLKHGARKVYAVDVGTEQLHPSLRGDKRIELHEKTDIRDVYATDNIRNANSGVRSLNHLPQADDSSARLESVITTDSTAPIIAIPDIILIDVSFISLREILPHIVKNIVGDKTQIAAMVKPQFEAGFGQTNRGVIKNDTQRRQILRDFETWAKQHFVIIDKHDSDVAGAKGNRERFYLLTLNRNSTTSPGRII